MRVTFVGGPLHGTTDEMEPAPNRHWHESETGEKTLYAIQSEDAFSVGTNPLKTIHVWYAPVGTTQEEFYAKRKELPDPIAP